MRIRTMPDARREFVRHFSPRLLLAFVGVSLVVRLIVGEWRWSNLVVVIAVLALQPFLEWVLHVTLLHDRPHEIAGRTFDTVAAQDHRKHHADPRDIPLTFMAASSADRSDALTVVVLKMSAKAIKHPNASMMPTNA